MNKQAFQVGQMVSFNYGFRSVYGIVKEDRGPIGMKGRVLYLIEFQHAGLPYVSHIELPAVELEPVTMFHVRDALTGIDVFLGTDPTKDPKRDDYVTEVVADVTFVRRDRPGSIPEDGAYPNVMPCLGVSGRHYREFNDERECRAARYKCLGRRWCEIHETWTEFRKANPIRRTSDAR